MPVVVTGTTFVSTNSFGATGYTPDTTGVFTGDLMIVAIYRYPGGATGITPPSGWTLEASAAGPFGDFCEFYSKVALADNPTEAWTFGSGSQLIGILTVVGPGFSVATPITTSIATTDDTLGNVSYIANDLVLGLTIGSSPFAPVTTSGPPSGFTDVEKKSQGSFAFYAVSQVSKLEASGSGNTSGLSFPYTAGGDLKTLTLLIAADSSPVPTIVTPPVVSGTTEVGFTLSTTDGTWDESPTGYSYDWQRSADGISGWSSVGSDQNTLDLVPGDDGFFFKCAVTASNGSGDGAPSDSNVVGPVTSFPTVTRFSLIG